MKRPENLALMHRLHGGLGFFWSLRRKWRLFCDRKKIRANGAGNRRNGSAGIFPAG